ncbi:MAG: M48 family metallopeptidase [Gemmatimonadales bacterium]|nr:M48 family metallopeptidase [Gemmatimonadales bacterium]
MKITREQAVVSGRVLQYQVRLHRRARRASVQVTRREGVVVTLPWRAPRRVLPGLMAEWESWLEGQVEECGVWDGPVVREFASGSILSILGRPRELVLEPLAAGRSRPTARLEADALILCMPTERLLEPRAELEKYLRRLARSDFSERVDSWSELIGPRPSRLIIGERKSRWGSCSRRGTLSFCYRLVMAPPETIDAVVAHEVCHLVHLNHSPRFYALLDRVCPGHREAMVWLNEHENDLMV